MLFPSTLVIGTDTSTIQRLLMEAGHQQVANNPDIFTVTDYSIATIRSLNHFLSQKPLQHPSLVVLIPAADLLNTESQNALLKNLEEPGANHFFILSTSHPYSLLATIISRCQIIRTPTLPVPTDDAIKFSNSVNENLLISEKLSADKDALIPYLQNQLIIYQQQLVDQPSLHTSLHIKKIIKAINMIRANVDPRSALDFMLLS